MIQNIFLDDPVLSGWEIKRVGTDILIYKSPRMNEAREYNATLNEDSITAFLDHEKECYLNQIMRPVAEKLYLVQSDIRRQIKIHIDKGWPIPPEISVDLKLKLV